MSILAAVGGAEAAASGESVVLSTIFNSAIARSRQAPMAERCDANLFEVLIGQIRQDDKANIILGKTLSVLRETELSSQSATCCIAAAPRRFQQHGTLSIPARPEQ